jgi:hypothetical protein
MTRSSQRGSCRRSAISSPPSWCFRLWQKTCWPRSRPTTRHKFSKVFSAVPSSTTHYATDFGEFRAGLELPDLQHLVLVCAGGDDHQPRREFAGLHVWVFHVHALHLRDQHCVAHHRLHLHLRLHNGVLAFHDFLVHLGFLCGTSGGFRVVHHIWDPLPRYCESRLRRRLYLNRDAHWIFHSRCTWGNGCTPSLSCKWSEAGGGEGKVGRGAGLDRVG